MEWDINKSKANCQQNLLSQQEEFLNKIEAIPSKVVLYLENFMDRAKLWPSSGKALVAVSGGADSLFLLNMLWLLKKKGRIHELIILHVNHGTRAETKKEEEFLRDYACTLDLLLKVKRLHMNPKDSNFEEKARKARYQFFFEHLKVGDRLYLGHHIDDSLEWSLLCAFKSGETRGRLGIPLVRGAIARPLFCFSRAQIKRLMKEAKLPYFEDQSNKNTKYERNFVRTELLARVKTRFPSYLKHYVRQSNALALKLGLSRLTEEALCDVIQLVGCTVLRLKNWQEEFPEELIKQAIYTHSKEGRGRIGEQLRKLHEAVRAEKWGPLSFSGGVEVHMRPGYLYILQGRSRGLEELDREQEQFLKNKITAQIPLDLKFSTKQNFESIKTSSFPYLFSLNKQDMDRSRSGLKKIDPLFPKSTEFALKQGIWFYYSAKALSDKKLLKKQASFCTN